MEFYAILAAAVLLVHLAWLLWVIFGAIFTRTRPVLAGFHIFSLMYGVAIEILPYPCPLTLLEQWAQQRAGLPAYEGAFLVYYLDRLVYPNIDAAILIAGSVIVCIANMIVYLRRFHVASRGASSVREPC